MPAAKKKAPPKKKAARKKKVPGVGALSGVQMSKEIEMIPISELKLLENNPRVNDEAAVRLAKLIAQYGFVTPITVDPSNRVLKGNTGVKAGRLLKLKHIPAVRVDFAHAKGMLYAIADNKSSEFAEWEEELLQEIMARDELLEFAGDREGLAAMTGFSADELRGLNLEPDLKKITGVDPTSVGLRGLIRIKCEPDDKEKIVAWLEKALKIRFKKVEVE